MATAAELLANGLGHDDTTLVIDNYLRTINIPKRVTNLGVEYDDDVLRLNFKMPRYLDDTDLSTFTIRINYVNANGDGDIYTVSDKVVGSDSISFSWLVGPTATAYKGNTKFNVCMKIVDEDGIVQREYNTAIASLPVLEGLEVDEQVASVYSDLIEQWKRELFGIGDTEEANMRAVSQEEQENIAQKGAEVLATIPEEYQETAEAAQEGIRTKADAIICTAEGQMITIDDSSDDHIRGLRVFGKTTQVSTTGTNLFNPYAEQNNSFGTATVENNGARITVNGTYYVSWPLVLKAGVTYYINFETVGSATNRAIRFEYPDKEITGTVTNPASFTPTKDTVSVYLYAGLGTQDTVIYENVQISEGSSAIPWEPYSGGIVSPSPEWPQPLVNIENSTVDIYGKNLAVQKYAIDTTTKGVRIFTQNNASEALLNGTAESLFSHTVLRTGQLPPGTYTVSAIGVNLHDDGHDRLYVADYYTGKVYANYIRDSSPKTITITEPARFRIDMVFKAGTVYNNTILKIQIETGTEATEYEPCKTIRSVSADYTIAGIPVTSGGNYTDTNDQQWVCDEIDFERGVHVQRIGKVVIDGTVAPTVFSPGTNGGTAFGFNYSDVGMDNILRNRCPKLCDRLMPMPDTTIASWKMCRIGYWCFNTDGSADNFLIMNAGEFESADAAQTWLKSNHIAFQYILRTPIETPLSSAEIEGFKALCSNYPNTTVYNDANAHMQLSYNVDTKTYVDNGIKKTVTKVMEAIENGSY